LCTKITLPQGNNRDISFGNPENAHIFGRREQAPALRYPKDIFIDNIDKPKFSICIEKSSVVFGLAGIHGAFVYSFIYCAVLLLLS